MKQPARDICRQCGGEVIVMPTTSPWDFAAECACGKWLIAWAAWNPPPEYQRTETQLALNFEAEGA